MAIYGLNHYGVSFNGWPFDKEGLGDLSLFLGLAGVGYFYLNMYTNTITNIVVIHPEDFKYCHNKYHFSSEIWFVHHKYLLEI